MASEAKLHFRGRSRDHRPKLGSNWKNLGVFQLALLQGTA